MRDIAIDCHLTQSRCMSKIVLPFEPTCDNLRNIGSLVARNAEKGSVNIVNDDGSRFRILERSIRFPSFSYNRRWKNGMAKSTTISEIA